MDWNTFVEGLKIFWNQPVPIIGFSVGTLIIGILFIVSKTSIGKKALNKLKTLYEDLKKKLEEALLKCEDYANKLEESEEKIKEVIAKKDEEIKQLTNEYELKLTNYKSQLLKQAEMIKVICENSVNKNIKDAYKNYIPEDLDLPIGELKTQIEEKVKAEYDDRLKALEELVYGKGKETTND